MDLIDRLRELSSRIPKLKEGGLVTTEEGAKNALVMPFIQALGYDVFNPLEVTPELTADVGTKKGEKVDYAIMLDGKPIILFECKGFGVSLKNAHVSQLYRYFSVTDTRFGILTNGVEYWFYSDLNEPNRMDNDPFFKFNLMEITETGVDTLKQFSKSEFNQEEIITRASELKYRNAIMQCIKTLYDEPTDDFVKLCLKDVYNGRFTQAVIDQYKPITKKAFRAFIQEQLKEKFNTVLASDPHVDTDEVTAVTEENAPEADSSENKIVTTQEELDGYFTVKAIVRDVVEAKRITLRDAQSYCTVLVDDNNRKILCRLRFNSATKKYIGILDESKNEELIPIESVDDIYAHADKLMARAQIFAS